MSKSLYGLQTKLIIVTGASSGIGQQCAITCSQMGATVILFGRNQARLDETLARMSEPETHTSYAIDLVEYDKIADSVSDIVRKKGRIDGIIHCAGISTTLPLNAVSHQKMLLYLQTNVIGAVNLTRHVIKPLHFSEGGGSIIYMASVMGEVGEIGKTLYSMTKGALIAATKSMSVELAPRKIRVNCISPGVVKTPMSENAVYSRDEASLDRVRALHPLGLGTPEDVANACVFLLSDASRWITGTNMIVDGGYLSR
jgi:NAD(P)-dependent dehydrogenase (short-subunit alcohol dehydrogenase family)